MTDPCFRLSGLAFAYERERPVLQGIDLDLHPGDRAALTGPNGAGKSTLLHLMLGLRPAAAGTIEAFGRRCRREADFREVRARAGLLFQDPDDQLFCPTVAEDVAFGPRNLGHSRAEAGRIAAAALARVGLAGFGPRVPYRLSGGEKRLVALAAVLAMEPEVLLLDEPTAGLDADAAANLMEILTGLPQAMIIVSHDRTVLARLANRTLVLKDGRLREAPPPLFVPPQPHGPRK